MTALPLYYAENLVVLENGTAYQLTNKFPDYSSLLAELVSLYKNASFTTTADGDATVYGVSVEGESAKTLLEITMPAIADRISDGQTLSAAVRMEGRSVEEVTLSASGTLNDKDQTPFTVYVTLDDFAASADFSVPDAVLESLDKTYADGALPVITDDLFRLLDGWSNLFAQETIAADLDLSVDCGPVVVKNALRYYRETVDGINVNCINKSGLNIFFSDSESAVTASGEEASGEARSLTGTAKLLDIVYLVCQNGDFTSEQDGNTYRYRVALDSRSMDEILDVLAPDAAKLDIDFTDSTAGVTICDDVVTELTISCGGSVKVLLTQASASVTAEVHFVDEPMPEIPDAALKALQ